MKSPKSQSTNMGFKTLTYCLKQALKLSPLLLLFSSPLAYSKLTIIRTPVTDTQASTTAHTATATVQQASPHLTKRTAAPYVNNSDAVTDNNLTDKDLPFTSYTSTPIISTVIPTMVINPQHSVQTTIETQSVQADKTMMPQVGTLAKTSLPSESIESQTLTIDEVRTLVRIKHPVKRPESMPTSPLIPADTPITVKAPLAKDSVAVVEPVTQALAVKSTPTESANTASVATEFVPLLISDKSPRRAQMTPNSTDDIIIATPNRNLPSELNKRIHMPTITISLKDLLAVIESYSPVDLTLAREVNADKTNRIRSVRSIPLKHLLNRALESDHLTYKSIGQNLLFIYQDDAYSNCIYNRLNSEKLAPNHTSQAALASVTVEDYSHKYSLDDTNRASIRMDDKSIDSTLGFITSFTNQQVYYDSELLFPYTGSSTSSNPDSTDSINLRNKNLNQVLTILSYRNGLDYQFIGDDILLITENPNLEVCKGFLEDSAD